MWDTPGKVSFEILQPWLQGNLVFFFNIKFNLLDKVTSLGFWDATETMLSNLEKELEEYVQFRCLVLLLIFLLCSFQCFLVIIFMTHCDPRNGYVHHVPENGGAVPINEVSIHSLLACLNMF